MAFLLSSCWTKREKSMFSNLGNIFDMLFTALLSSKLEQRTFEEIQKKHQIVCKHAGIREMTQYENVATKD